MDGLVTPASRRAANGCAATCWLWPDAAPDSDGDETGAETATLGTLGTFATPGSHMNDKGVLATGRPRRPLWKVDTIQWLDPADSGLPRQALRAGRHHPARFADTRKKEGAFRHVLLADQPAQRWKGLRTARQPWRSAASDLIVLTDQRDAWAPGRLQGSRCSARGADRHTNPTDEYGRMGC